jgi:polyribonucleotide nucleotidyltransferase
MDFKVAGTVDGITAVQMDLKIQGISTELVRKALADAKTARLFIMDKMMQAIAKPKEKISDFAPHIESFKISQDKIGAVIGPGGKNIKKIIADTGCTVDIDDDGVVQVASQDGAAIAKAVAMIKGMVEEAEVGKIYAGKITRLMNFGAFCEILPGKEGLIHVSELAPKFVKTVDEVVKTGDVVTVKCIEIDDQGRVNLSIKQADPNYVPEPRPEGAPEPRRERPPRREFRR